MAKLPLIEDDNDLLSVLRAADDEMLKPLVAYITDNGKGRWASKLDTLAVYKSNPDRPSLYADEIASEIQTFGANSLASLLRGGEGVRYAEVVHDVADKLDVNYSPKMDVAAIEQQILLKVLEKSWEKMSDAERAALLDTLGVDHRDGIPKALPVIALQAAISLSGFVAYQIALIVANAVARYLLGRGLSLVVNASLMRVIGALAGPVGWGITAVWTILDVASPDIA